MNLINSLVLLCVILKCVVCDTGGITAQELPLCKVHLSKSEVSYTNFFKVMSFHRNASANLMFDFHFAVMAPSDAHILIAPSNQISKQDPVYEIVLGAGANSFSDIRRLQKSGVKKTSRTKNLLSSIEPRAFWLHINKNGLIEVGRANEELAFLSYIDPSPLPVEVFSFNTWPGIEAKWYYDCPKPNLPNIPTIDEEIKKPLSGSERLKKQLFLQYDPYVRPVLDTQDLTVINLKFVYDRINLDEKKSKMSIQGTMNLEWRDEKIFWNASDYGNISSFHVYFREIWLPNLVVFNAASGMGTDFLRSTLIEINSEGWVTWKAFVNNLEVWCDPSGISIQNWPADEHTCDIQLGFMTDQNSYLMHIQMESDVQQSEWKVLSTSNDILVYTQEYLRVDVEDIEDSLKAYVMTFQIQRKSQTYGALYHAPIFAIYISMLLTFFMSAKEPYRISLNCLQIILLSILFANISLKMPPFYSGMPSIVMLYVHGIYGAVFSLVISVLVINLTRIRQKHDLPNFLCIIVASYFFRTFVKFEFTKSAESYDNLTADSVSTCSLDKQEAWNMLAKLIDRIVFTVYLFFVIYHICRYM